MKSLLTHGTPVQHRIYGHGVVMAEWGAFWACRSCYVELTSPLILCPECAAKRPEHDQELFYPLHVSGRGVYDVAFFADGKVHAVNQHWLRPVLKAEAA